MISAMHDATDPQTPLPSAQSALGIAIRIELERLATIRTAYSSGRALKSWMRTAVSLYTFGFAVAKFFDYVALEQGGLQYSDGPRWLGLALVVAGIVSLALAVAQYLSRLATMSDLGLPHPAHYLLPAAAAAALTTIGIAAAISISLS
jgi:putative membrane protein